MECSKWDCAQLALCRPYFLGLNACAAQVNLGEGMVRSGDAQARLTLIASLPAAVAACEATLLVIECRR